MITGIGQFFLSKFAYLESGLMLWELFMTKFIAGACVYTIIYLCLLLIVGV